MKRTMNSYNRKELIEMLLKLSEENGALKEKIAKLEERIEKQTLIIYEKNSVAEIGIKLTGVFEVIEEAKLKYLSNQRELDKYK